MPVQWNGVLQSPQQLAAVIQGESSTVEGQFAVASTMFNRSTIAGPYAGGGSNDLTQVVTPTNFNGYNPNPSPYATQLANDLWGGNAPSGGNPGNATFFASPNSANNDWANPNSAAGSSFFGSATNIGGNYFSDRQGVPSNSFQAPTYGGSTSSSAWEPSYTDPTNPADIPSGANDLPGGSYLSGPGITPAPDQSGQNLNYNTGDFWTPSGYQGDPNHPGQIPVSTGNDITSMEAGSGLASSGQTTFDGLPLGETTGQISGGINDIGTPDFNAASTLPASQGYTPPYQTNPAGNATTGIQDVPTAGGATPNVTSNIGPASAVPAISDVYTLGIPEQLKALTTGAQYNTIAQDQTNQNIATGNQAASTSWIANIETYATDLGTRAFVILFALILLAGGMALIVFPGVRKTAGHLV